MKKEILSFSSGSRYLPASLVSTASFDLRMNVCMCAVTSASLMKLKDVLLTAYCVTAVLVHEVLQALHL